MEVKSSLEKIFTPMLRKISNRLGELVEEKQYLEKLLRGRGLHART
jgi:hypothetical protein